MNFANTVRIVLAINFMILYSQAQRDEGSPCRLHDDNQGICKYYVDCKWLEESLEMGKLKYSDIVGCSFRDDRRIVCCDNLSTGNERPLGPDMKQPIDETMPITNGVRVELGEFPWIAALGYQSNDDNMTRYDCSGTIISEFFVLTAAHCAPKGAAPHVVRMGKVTPRTDDDGAIPIDIKIRLSIFFILFPKKATVLSPRLLKTNVISMEPLELCNKTLIEINRRADEPALRNGLSLSQYCAFDPMARSDACAGDSGGPLQVFLDQPNIAWIVGIILFGVSCATRAPAVYTRVVSYIDWILPIVWPEL